MPSTTGAAIPTAGLGDHTESTIARQVKPSVGARTVAQLSATSRNASDAGMVWPDRPSIGSWPRTTTLETMVEAARTARTTTVKPPAVSVLAQNSWARLVERVR